MEQKWLFARYPQNELLSWAKRIKYFRFVFDYQINSGTEDSLELKLRYSSAEEFFSHLKVLSIAPQKLSSGSIQPKYGQSYSAKEAEKFEVEIEDVPGFQQPRLCKIQDQYVFLYAHKGVLQIQISGPVCPPCEIDNEDIQSAERIEPIFEPLSMYLIDPPVDTPYCFCPKYYPEYF